MNRPALPSESPDAVLSPDRDIKVRRVLIIELCLNVLIAGFKAAIGLWTGSLAIVSDALHSLMDGTNNVIGLVVLRWSSQPADREHPYGHRKFETLAAACIGVLIAIVALRLGWSAIQNLISGTSITRINTVTILLLSVTLAINIFIAVYENYQAKRLRSAYLAADAAHTASDVLVTVLVLLSFLAASAGYTWADPVGALIVATVIARVAWQVLLRSLAPLADSAVLDPEDISAVCLSVDNVRGCHQIRSRGTTPFLYVDLHLVLDGKQSLEQAHTTAHEVEALLIQKYPDIADVTIHLEPDNDTCQ